MRIDREQETSTGSGTTPAASDVALVVARGLVKDFPAAERRGEPFHAVKGIDFTLHRGEALGFLGPNGAGKSSTMRMVACVSPVTGGSLRLFGLDPAVHGREIRSRIGVVPQDDALDLDLSVRENLTIYGRYFGVPKRELRDRVERLLSFAQLQDKADGKVDELSGGMRRRLTIARSLINEPEVLLLDEPTTGLDPQARHMLWDQLFRLKEGGTSLILTTHYMDEAEQLCDRLVIMDDGGIVAHGSPRALIDEYASRDVIELRLPIGEKENGVVRVRQACTGERVEQLPDRIVVHTSDGEASLARIMQFGLQPLAALVRRATLEDVFLNLTGHSLVD